MNFLSFRGFFIFFSKFFLNFSELKINFSDFYKCAGDVAQSGASDQSPIDDQAGR